MPRLKRVIVILFLFVTIGLSSCGLFGEEEYTVTFDFMHGNEQETQKADAGETLQPPNASREGYTLLGWYTSLDGGTTLAEKWSFNQDTIQGDLMLYAKWEVNQYTIHFNTAGGSEVTEITQDYGSHITAPEAPTKEGYVFAGWHPLIPDKMPATNMILTALWNDSYVSYLSSSNPVVTLEFEGMSDIKIELFPEIAPNTVHNFIHLVQNGYYDGVEFHRVIENFMIQGGWGEPLSCRLEGEFTSNGFSNALEHTRGVISMARTMDPNSATGQFFIVHQNSPHLDGQYAAFGAMIEGFDTLDTIAKTATGAQDRPLDSIQITRATVDTKQVEYPLPLCYDPSR